MLRKERCYIGSTSTVNTYYKMIQTPTKSPNRLCLTTYLNKILCDIWKVVFWKFYLYISYQNSRVLEISLYSDFEIYRYLKGLLEWSMILHAVSSDLLEIAGGFYGYRYALEGLGWVISWSAYDIIIIHTSKSVVHCNN